MRRGCATPIATEKKRVANFSCDLVATIYPRGSASRDVNSWSVFCAFERHARYDKCFECRGAGVGRNGGGFLEKKIQLPNGRKCDLILTLEDLRWNKDDFIFKENPAEKVLFSVEYFRNG